MRKRKLLVALSLCTVIVGGVIASITVANKKEVKAEEVTEMVGNESIELSEYNEDVRITDEEEIKIIAEQYDLPNGEDIEEIIYSPLEEEPLDLGEISREIGFNEYYVKKKGSTEKKGRLLRSSWYESPGASMSVSETIAIGVNFSRAAAVSGGIKKVKAELTASYGFNVSKSVTCTDTQNIKVSEGKKRNVKAYVNIKTYNFELWEADQWYDDKIGKGSIKRPVGVIFVRGKEVKA